MRISAELDDYVASDGKATVQLVFVRGTRARKRLGVRIEPEHWDHKRQRVKVGHIHQGALNKTIRSAIDQAEGIVAENPEISPAELRSAMGVASGLSFYEVAHRDLKETPPKSWHTRAQRKQRIEQFHKVFPGISAKAVTPQTFAQYKAHLEASGISSNSVATQLRSLRTIYVRTCKRIGVVPRRVLDGLGAVEKYRKPKSVLTPEEVGLLAEYAGTVSGWEAKAVHMWLFSLYAGGIRWTDLCRLTDKNLQGGRVTFVASKTGKAKNVPLMKEARAIVALYKGEKTLFGTPTDDRGIASVNVVSNRMLKVAAKACGIKTRLHNHNARHTSAAFLFAQRIDDRIIMEILGVDARVFVHYKASVTSEDIDEAMEKTFKSR